MEAPSLLLPYPPQQDKDPGWQQSLCKVSLRTGPPAQGPQYLFPFLSGLSTSENLRCFKVGDPVFNLIAFLFYLFIYLLLLLLYTNYLRIFTIFVFAT